MAAKATLCLKNDENALCLNDLPDDPLLIIFFMLPLEERLRLELVCKRWENLLKESWQNIKQLHMWSSFGKATKTWRFSSLQQYRTVWNRCGPYVVSINFQYWEETDDNWIEILTDFVHTDFPKLKEVDLGDVRFLPVNCLPLLGHLQQLESVSICLPKHKIQYNWSVEGAENHLAQLLQPLVSLKQLKLNGLPLDGRCLEQASMTLQKIEIFECEDIDLSYFFRSGIREQLTEFSFIDWSSLLKNNSEILLSGAPNLRTLDLGDTQINEDFFENLAEFRKIEQLCLNGIWDYQVNDDYQWQHLFLQHMSQSASAHCLRVLHLRDFITSGLDEQELRKFSSFSKHLKELTLAYSEDLTIGKLESILGCCQELELLDLSFSDLHDDAALAAVARLCPNLVHLDVTGTVTMATFNVKVSSKGIEALVDGIFGSDKRQSGIHFVIYVSHKKIIVKDKKVQNLLAKYKKFDIRPCSCCQTLIKCASK